MYQIIFGLELLVYLSNGLIPLYIEICVKAQALKFVLIY